MPPKKAGKKKTGTKAKKPKLIRAPKGDGPSSTEITLRLELQSLEAELVAARQETEAARKQHEWLSSEARQTEEEIAQYETYMGSKAQREQKKLKSLNEHNTVELGAIAAERKSLEESFSLQKQELKQEIFQRQNELGQLRKQLEALNVFKVKREAQEEEIRVLEKRLDDMVAAHNEKLTALKASLLNDRLAYQKETQAIVRDLETNAKKEAAVSLSSHASQVSQENLKLRKELFDLIRQNKVLQQREATLKTQNAQLLRQCELNDGVAARRDSRLAKS